MIIYCTGLGAFTTNLKSGQLAPTPPPNTRNTPLVTIGGASATVTQSSAAPGYVGLYQVAVQIPASSQKGSAVTMTLAAGEVSSNAVTIAIQ